MCTYIHKYYTLAHMHLHIYTGVLHLYSAQAESSGESSNELLAVPLLHPKESSVVFMSHYGGAGQLIIFMKWILSCHTLSHHIM